MFVDRVKVTLLAGKGGNGCVSFRREKGVPYGGPDGGRGGDGASICLVSDKSLKSLAYFRFHPINKAQRGAHGEGGNRQGKRGRDSYLKVPVGTVVKEQDNIEILFDFIASGQEFLAAKGGKGGRGNDSFATPTHQAPRMREEGKPGEEKNLILELKLIADVGLIGFPNVGKSTLISKISAAKPTIADYPFTTLIPNLGVVDADEFKSFVVADIPGLIEGAHLGHGLGTSFLRHVERTKLLVHLVDVSPYSIGSPVQNYRAVIRELEAFNPQLVQRKQMLVVNKIDLLGRDLKNLNMIKSLAKNEGVPFFEISALNGTGLRGLVSSIAKTLDNLMNK
ncbi:GTPase ObgE [Acidobacteriota bacterium]